MVQPQAGKSEALVSERSSGSPADGKEEAGQLEETLFAVHRRMLITLFAGTLVLVSVMAAPAICESFTGKPSSYSTLFLVLAAGMLGAFASALQRAYSFERINPSFLAQHRTTRLNWFISIYALVPPLVGAISALVVYVFFQTRIFSSPLFPDFVCKIGGKAPGYVCNALTDFFAFGPSEMTDFAKVLLWGFVAGFSERLVPNLVSKLSDSMAGTLPGADAGLRNPEERA